MSNRRQFFEKQNSEQQLSLPSIGTSSIYRDKAISFDDFAGSTPIIRRGMVDIFGLAESDIKFPLGSLRTPRDIKTRLQNECGNLNNLVSETKVRSKARRKANPSHGEKPSFRVPSAHTPVTPIRDLVAFAMAEPMEFNRNYGASEYFLTDFEKAKRKATLILKHSVNINDEEEEEVVEQQGKVQKNNGNNTGGTMKLMLESMRPNFDASELDAFNIFENSSFSSQTSTVGDLTVAEMNIESMSEFDGKINKYFGMEARNSFVSLYKESHNSLRKYPNESDIPEDMKSPRMSYLREVSRAGIAPLSLVLRKENRPNGIFLAHRGLGDKRVLPIINTIDKLPAVETLDLCDNRLTDLSLMPLTLKILSMKNLTHLDLSFNKIDQSSKTVMHYLKSYDCQLKTLLLNGADVDDNESINLFEAISVNKSVITLGLSKNMIGCSELQKSVDPEMMTGSKAIREMLKVNTTLKELDLSWNSIRLQSSVEIGLAIELNSTLRSLNVAHNTFGDVGTQMLGKSLAFNNSLKALNISCNSITPKAAVVLANGLFHNKSIQFLNIDGNILGEVGSQAFVAAIQRSTFSGTKSSGQPRRLKVSMNNCDCRQTANNVFNASNPSGHWVLDLSEPYGLMVAKECIFLANFRAGCAIKQLMYNNTVIKLERYTPKNIKKFSFEEHQTQCKSAASELLSGRFEKASVFVDKILLQFGFSMNHDLNIEVLETTKNNWTTGGKDIHRSDLGEVLLYEIFHALFMVYDTDGSNTMELSEIYDALISLGKTDVDPYMLQRAMAMYDKDESGTIDADEFSMIMVNEFCRTDTPKGILVDKATGKPWAIPSSGSAVIDIAYQCEIPNTHDVCDDQGIDSVLIAIKEAKTVELKELIFEQATSSPYFFLTADQGQRLYDEIQGFSRTALDTIACLLPQLVDGDNICAFIDNNMTDIGKLALRVRLGQLYNAYIGFPSGHYCIDLKVREQRQGAKRLSATSGAEAKFCYHMELDTSQKGNNSNFRNEKMGSSQLMSLNSSWFASCPSDGILHFDYVSTSRPRQGSRPISNSRFDNFLLKMDFPTMAEKIAESREEALKVMQVKGSSTGNELDKSDRPVIYGNAEVLTILAEDSSSTGHIATDVYFDMDLSRIVELSQHQSVNSPPSTISFREGVNNLSSPKTGSSQNNNTKLFKDGGDFSSSGTGGRTDSKSPKTRSGRTDASKSSRSPRQTLSRGSQRRTSDARESATATPDHALSHDTSTKKMTLNYDRVISHPLTLNFVKDQFHEYMDTSHRFYDIYPVERMRDISRINYDPNRTPRTPDDIKLPPPPNRTIMPLFYPIAYRKLLELQIIMPGLYFSVQQVVEILRYFPSEAYIRIQLIQSLFSHIIDLENFDLIFDKIFDDDERREAIHRIGILNILNPVKPDRYYTLDLRRWEQREFCKILISLAIAEPGENWENEDYRLGKYDDSIPGWILPASWTLEDRGSTFDSGPRPHGYVRLRYRSEGFGCNPVLVVRNALKKKTLSGVKRII